MEKRSFSRNFEKIHGFDSIFELELPPILTKPAKFNMVREPKKKEMTEPTKFRRSSAKMEERTAYGSLPVKVVKEKSIKTWKEQKSSPPPVRRSSPCSPGVKLRVNSPRIASRKIQAYNRKALPSARSTRPRRRNLSDSLAVVKRSLNPQKDFRDSMLEMIVSYKILSSKDLEELLACYLSLNSNEYHDLIVKVFKQIWFDLADIRS